ncbi:hypothetical protein HN789_05475 [archaeon]|jgi:uncharacterized protein YycO|nr:hypothetical protein [archaeon]MBT3720309.1 hypothetical protein [archaeon]MBT4022963.1 hypothetical protein [archaeon]MBT4271954.1 hypothetical protein [archaeon]MBT4461792.1 hypothetical protein [archaeon]
MSLKLRNIFKNYKVLNKYPKYFTPFKKVFYQIAYLIAGTNVKTREAWLKKKKIKKIKKILRKGDIMILGDLKTILSYFVDGSVTHAGIWAGKGKMIHAIGTGVQFMKIKDIFAEYDTLAILRISPFIKKKRYIIYKALQYAKKQLGKPYNFELNTTKGNFFCSQLVNDSFKAAGYNTGLENFRDNPSFKSNILKLINDKGDPLEPGWFLEGNFEVIFVSPNMVIKNNRFYLKESQKKK